MLLSPRRDAHLCQRPSGVRHNDVLPASENYLASSNELAKEDRNIDHFRRRYTVSIPKS